MSIQRQDIRNWWSLKWDTAWSNMPKRALKRGNGQQALLAQILGCNSNRVFNGWDSGEQPRCPIRRAKLLKLAGPYGNVLAWGWLYKRAVRLICISNEGVMSKRDWVQAVTLFAVSTLVTVLVAII